MLAQSSCLSKASVDEVKGQPVHEEGLQPSHSHGQVHAYLVLGVPPRDPFGCLRQDLQAQRTDLEEGGWMKETH